MRTSDTKTEYGVPERDDRDPVVGVSIHDAVSFDASSSDPYADAELKLRSERTEEMIRRAEGYAR